MRRRQEQSSEYEGLEVQAPLIRHSIRRKEWEERSLKVTHTGDGAGDRALSIA